MATKMWTMIWAHIQRTHEFAYKESPFPLSMLELLNTQKPQQ